MLRILFYDGHCPFCLMGYNTLLSTTKKYIFRFAPLTGEMATFFLKNGA